MVMIEIIMIHILTRPHALAVLCTDQVTQARQTISEQPIIVNCHMEDMNKPQLMSEQKQSRLNITTQIIMGVISTAINMLTITTETHGTKSIGAIEIMIIPLEIIGITGKKVILSY